MMSTPKRKLVFACVVLLSIAAVIASGLYWQSTSQARRIAICEAVVQGRNDNRAMWLYLLNQEVSREGELSNAEQAEVDRFTLALNTRLPELACDDSGHTFEVATSDGGDDGKSPVLDSGD